MTKGCKRFAYQGWIQATFFYKNSFYKNHEAQNSQKIKNIIRIMPRLKF